MILPDDYLVEVYFNDLPIGTKFYTYQAVGFLTPELLKLTKHNVLYRGVPQRFPKPKSRKVFLLIPRNKYIDFLEQNPHTIPSTQELIELHNRP
jgi:hypothetical protein